MEQQEAKPKKLWVRGKLVDAAEVDAILARVQDAKKKPETTEIAPEEQEAAAMEHLRYLRMKDAIAAFEAILKDNPDRPVANAGLGACHLHMRDYPLALAGFEKALEKDPALGRALYGAAICYNEAGDTEKAISCATRQTEVADEEDRARGHYMLGRLAKSGASRAKSDEARREALESAAKHFEDGLTAYPAKWRDLPQPSGFEIRHRHELALIYRDLGLFDKALEHLDWVTSGGRLPRTVALAMGNISLAVGKLDQAERAFRAQLRHNSEDRNALVGLGRVLLAKREPGHAIRPFSQVLSRADADRDALQGIAEAYKQLGEIDKAASYFAELYRLPE